MAKPYQELRDKHFTPDEQAKQDAQARELVLDYTLGELRKKLAQLTQAQLGEFLDVSQTQISKYEAGGDMLLSTLRRIVEARGGEIRVQARLTDRDWVTLRDLSHPEKDLVSA